VTQIGAQNVLAFRAVFVHIGSMNAAPSSEIGCAPTEQDPEAAEALRAAEQDPARIAQQILLLRRFSAFALEEAERLSQVSEEQTARLLARLAAPGDAPIAPEPRFIDFSLALSRLARIARLSIALEQRLIAALRRPDHRGGGARTARPGPAAAPGETTFGQTEAPETVAPESEPREAEAPEAETTRPHDELARELRGLLPGGLSAGGPFEAAPGIAELEALTRVHLQQFGADRSGRGSGETGANGAGPGAAGPEAVLQSLLHGRPRPADGRRRAEADGRDAAPAPTASSGDAESIEPPDAELATAETAPPPTGQSRIGWAPSARSSVPLQPDRRPAGPSSAPEPAGPGPP
jgi:hypothetical protein